MGRLTLEQLRAARTDANVAAFLRAIRSGESNQDDSAFHLLVYGGRFDNLSDHPRIHKDRTTHQVVADWRHAPPNSTSSAAGAFQDTETTWDGLVKTYGFTNFLPETQELGAIALIAEHNALEDVLAGRIDAACAKLATTWTSLPGGPESNAKARERVRQVYADWGGWYEPHVGDGRAEPQQPAPLLSDATAPEASMADSILGTIAKTAISFIPGGPLVQALAGTLIDAFAPDVQAQIKGKLDSADPSIADKVHAAVVKTALAITGEENPVIAAGIAAKDPALIAQIQQAALDELDHLVPVIEKMGAMEQRAREQDEASRDAAEKRQGAATLRDVLAARSFYLMLGVIVTIGGLAIVQFVMKQAVAEAVMTALSMIAMAVVNEFKKPNTYAFGGEQSSAAAAALGRRVDKL